MALGHVPGSEDKATPSLLLHVRGTKLSELYPFVLVMGFQKSQNGRSYTEVCTSVQSPDVFKHLDTNIFDITIGTDDLPCRTMVAKQNVRVTQVADHLFV